MKICRLCTQRLCLRNTLLAAPLRLWINPHDEIVATVGDARVSLWMPDYCTVKVPQASNTTSCDNVTTCIWLHISWIWWIVVNSLAIAASAATTGHITRSGALVHQAYQLMLSVLQAAKPVQASDNLDGEQTLQELCRSAGTGCSRTS